MKAADGIAAVMYGPSVLTTEINGTKVSIEQRTNYPLSDEVTIVLKLDAPTRFALYFRQPAWTDAVESDTPIGEASAGFYRIDKEWKDGDDHGDGHHVNEDRQQHHDHH